MALDQNLPRFTGREGLEERVKRLQDYQYQLLEALRYMMHNLDTRNFNQVELNRFTGTITDPIYARIEDEAGNLTELSITAKGLATRVSDAEGNISTLQQTASLIQATVSNQAGQISILQQTAESIQLTVANQAGQISMLQQTAESIQLTVANQAGQISMLRQTAESIQLTVADQAGQISAIRQSVNSITLSVSNGEESSLIALYRDGIVVSSQNITLRGMVTFTDLETAGRTVIYGGNILTDSLFLNALHGDNIYLYNQYGNIGAEFRVGNASSAADRCELHARALWLGAWDGDAYLYSDRGYITLDAGAGVTSGNDFYPSRANAYACGTYGFPWRDVYSQDGTVSSSDRRGKKDIEYDMSRYSGLFDRLRPCSFLRTNGTSGRRHHGFIAQEVREALAAEGMTGKDFAGYVDWEDGEEYGFGLRYEEMIAMVVHEVQEIKKKLAGE